MNNVICNTCMLYKRALKREINVWRTNNVEADLDALDFLPYKFIFNAKEIEITKNCDWLDFIGLLGNFDRGLILGGGNSNFENYLLNKGTVKTFENIDIVFKDRIPSKKFNLFADLNFINLKENTYDIIIAKSILHHIINLEHLLCQVNKSLKQGGVFVVLDYIGENKQQWKKEKIIFINNILEKYNLKISSGAYDNSVPFESIRSEEISGIIDQIFSGHKIIEQKWDYIYSSMKVGLYHYHLRNNLDQNKTFLVNAENTIINSEKDAKKMNLFPTILFGIYKKNKTNVSIDVKKWDKNKIQKELELNFENFQYGVFKKVKLIVRDYYKYLFS